MFDGYQYHSGPLHVLIDGETISRVETGSPPPSSVDGSGKILSPGFYDGHTHLVFAGTRFHELALKLEGHSYSDILAQGGGIQSTVAATRSTSLEQLTTLVNKRLDVMLAHGTVGVEAKSGYGLEHSQEIKLLEVLNQVDHHVTVFPTFGAAHVYPSELSHEQYLNSILDDMLPEVKQRELAGSTDVFCDRGAFSVEDTMTIFERSSQLGLPNRVHAEELEYTGIGKLASSSYDLRSADHLLLASEDDFQVLAEHSTVAMFMPLAPFGLFTNVLPHGYQHTGVTIGLGSDFNPNNWAVSMQSAIRMAVYRYRLTPLQAIRAATSGSFQGITGQPLPRLEEGTSADFILLQATSLSEFVSKFGQNLVHSIYRSGSQLHINSHAVI